MCVIYSCHSAIPSKEELELGAEGNRDGAGLCWIDKFGTKDAQVMWLKGLPSTADAVLEAIKRQGITYPFGIHYRTASIGGKCEELTHPFPITDDLDDSTSGLARRVLMHNGHINDWKDWFTKIMFASANEIPVGPWSDSRALAAAVNVKGEGVLDFIIGSSRVMVLDSIASVGMDKKKPASYIRLYGNWINKEGYDQSTETACRVIKASPDAWRGRRHCHVKELGPVETPVKGNNPVHTENTWTVDELESLVSDLRKEQDEARVLLGC